MEGQTPSEEVEELFNMLKIKADISLNDYGNLVKNIGKKIALVRKELKYNQLEFSKKINMSRSRLAVFETGQIDKISTLCKIANALNKPMSWFFEEEKKESDLYKIIEGVVQHQLNERQKKYDK